MNGMFYLIAMLLYHLLLKIFIVLFGLSNFTIYKLRVLRFKILLVILWLVQLLHHKHIFHNQKTLT